MSEDSLSFLIDKFGSPKSAREVEREEITQLTGRVPSLLLEIWGRYGIGIWLNGKFQFASPRLYAPILNVVLSGDSELKPDQSYVYGYSAFGELYVWNENLRDIIITLPRLWAEASFTDPDFKPFTNPNNALTANLALLDRSENCNWREDSPGTPLMFNKVFKAAGQLELGEVYGFVPALELGGKAKVENVRRVRALEHFSILAQLGPVQLFDYSTGRQKFVRNLGGG